MNIQLEKYSVSITENFNDQQQKLMEVLNNNYSSIFILADENTSQYCYPLVKHHFPQHELLIISSGEGEKNITTCSYLWNLLLEKNAERKSLLVNLGGGVIGDMGGFVASTYKRGFNFLNIPTTLLAQVDASVGGKLGVDFNGIKNMIGVFNDPVTVLISTQFLETLPLQQLKSGFAEVLKHGLIYDKIYWSQVKSIDVAEFPIKADIIERSVSIKKEVVEIDPFESGLRKILNFGHTIGHAVETWSLQNDAEPLLHGEAIAIGIICEAWLSHKLNNLSEIELKEVVDTVPRFFIKYDVSKIPINELIVFMRSDKKNSGGNILFSLINSIGVCNYNIPVNEEKIKSAMQFYSEIS